MSAKSKKANAKKSINKNPMQQMQSKRLIEALPRGKGTGAVATTIRQLQQIPASALASTPAPAQILPSRPKADWRKPSFPVYFAVELVELSQARMTLEQQSTASFSFSNSNKAFLLEQKQDEHRKKLLHLHQVARLIRSQEQYGLLLRYYEYYLCLNEEQNLTEEEKGYVVIVMRSLFMLICHQEGKLLVGIDPSTNKPVWTPQPAFLENATSEDGADNEWFFAYTSLIKTMWFISSQPQQQVYDRLMLPSKDRWPSFSQFAALNLTNFQATLARSLGKQDGRFTKADVEKLLEKIALEREWFLVPGRPVVVRFQKHPLVHQIILMLKADYIMAKIEFHELGDCLEITRLDQVAWFGTFRTALDTVDNPEGSDNKDQYGNNGTNNHHRETEQSDDDDDDRDRNMAIPALIATVCLDLATVKKIVITDKHTVAGASGEGEDGSSLKAKAKAHKEKTPNSNSKEWYWQYVPRKQYQYSKETENDLQQLSPTVIEGEVVEREPLTTQQKELQHKLKRFHFVGLFVRRLPSGRLPSPLKVTQAVEMGIELKPGETWVAAHGRGFEELKRVVEDVGISNIPHFMRKRTGLPSA